MAVSTGVWLSAGQVGERAELEESTVRRYVRQQCVPAPDRWVDGQPQWRPATIKPWVSGRGPRRAQTSECGTVSGWRRGCGCAPCREAHNIDTRDWRRGMARLPEDVHPHTSAQVILRTPLTGARRPVPAPRSIPNPGAHLVYFNDDYALGDKVGTHTSKYTQ